MSTARRVLMMFRSHDFQSGTVPTHGNAPFSDKKTFPATLPM
jgi:hypothetical protein